MVSKSLEQLKVTRVAIAHRFSMIMHAHRIFVLHGGTVVQHGTYTALVQHDGLFATLARRQVASIAGDCRGCIKANSGNASRRFV